MLRFRIARRGAIPAVALTAAIGGAIAASNAFSIGGAGANLSAAFVAAPEDDAEITSRDINLFKRDLHLDEDQCELIDAIFDGYRRDFENASAAHRKRLESLYQQAQHTTDRSSINGQINSARGAWTQARLRLNRGFFESIRAMLSDAQLQRWHLVERDRRRRIMLSGPSRFAAETIDLVDLAEGLGLEPASRAALDSALDAWADEVDALLLARRAAEEQWAQQVEEPSAADHPPDPARREELRGRLDQRCRALRNVNLRYVDLATARLAAPAGDRFRAAFDLAAYPIIYRLTPADHYLAVVLALPDLSDEQRAAADSIRRDYDEQLLAINDQLAVIMRRQEDADPDREEMKRQAFEGPGGVQFDGKGNAVIGNLNGVVAMTVTTAPMPDQPALPRVIVPGLDRADPTSPQGQLEQRKGDLVRHTIDAALALLTAQQQAAAPRPTSREMISPEERMRRVMEKAFSTARITRNADGSVTFELHIDDEPPSPGQ